jgi:cytochrome P450
MAAHMLKTFPGDEELVKDIAAVIYLGGSDTVVAAVTSYFIAMVMNPRVQERVQEELDRVVGRERFPEFADKDNLPYLEAVMRECLRWLPVIPNGTSTSHTSFFFGLPGN